MKIFKLIIQKKRHNSLALAFKSNGAMPVTNCIPRETDYLFDTFSSYYEQKDLYFVNKEAAYKKYEEIREALRTLLGFYPDIEMTVKQVDVDET